MPRRHDDDVEYECTGSKPVEPPGLTLVWMYVFRTPLSHVKGCFVAGGDSIDAMMRIAQGTKQPELAGTVPRLARRS